jgi:16S rRNA U1498 N3-methylase RsmE
MLTPTELETTLLAILKIEDAEDLNRVAEILRERQQHLQKRAALKFRVGDRVKFSDKSGATIEGTITSFNPKTVAVKTAFGNWRVSPTFLKPVA